MSIAVSYVPRRKVVLNISFGLRPWCPCIDCPTFAARRWRFPFYLSVPIGQRPLFRELHPRDARFPQTLRSFVSAKGNHKHQPRPRPPIPGGALSRFRVSVLPSIQASNHLLSVHGAGFPRSRPCSWSRSSGFLACPFFELLHLLSNSAVNSS